MFVKIQKYRINNKYVNVWDFLIILFLIFSFVLFFIITFNGYRYVVFNDIMHFFFNQSNFLLIIIGVFIFSIIIIYFRINLLIISLIKYFLQIMDYCDFIVTPVNKYTKLNLFFFYFWRICFLRALFNLTVLFFFFLKNYDLFFYKFFFNMLFNLAQINYITNLYINNFIQLFIFRIITIILANLFVMLSYFIVLQQSTRETLTNYECGFMPFDETFSFFDIKFYLIAISFLIFDIEITFLFPWSQVFLKLRFLGLLSRIVFLILLIICFIIEWNNKGLDWSIINLNELN